MSRIKKFITSIVLAIGSAGTTTAHETLAHTFAECAGRFSAEMEHAWLMNQPDADAHQADRASFVTLTSATMDATDGRSVLSHRVEVKLAHAALLQQASFGASDARARVARQVANRHLVACRRLLLGS